MFNHIPMSNRPSRGIMRSGKKQIIRANRRIRRANKLERGKFYTFLSPTTSQAIYATPNMMGKVIGHIPDKAMVMYIDSVPFFYKNRKDNWMMFYIGYGELFGYVACHYSEAAEEEEFQAHRFFKRVYA